MKKMFAVMMAVAFAFSVAGFSVAADNAVKPMKAAEKSAASAEKSATAAKKSAKKAGEKVEDAVKPAATPAEKK